MSLEIMTNISVDFYDTKYIKINAKQYDNSSRWVAVSCYNQGKLLNLSSSKHSAYVRYRKADEYGVLNSCRINYRGEVLVELTEQMLSVDGICYVDLIIINKGSAMINIDTGEIITIDDSAILSTMAFCVDVYEVPFDNFLIESSYEYDGLNDLMERAEADYTEVIRLSKSYAVGDAGEIRDNEDIDNSKYYCEQAGIHAANAKTSEDNAKESETNAKESETNAKESEDSALISEQNAMVSEHNAKESEANALTSEQNAKESETNAAVSEVNSKTSENNAAASETAAATSEVNASISEANAATSEANAKDSEEKASNYCEIVKSVVDGLNSGFIPIGTITFAELATAEKATGFTYNISDDFVTDETFREGAGKAYTAGTNVYYTIDNYWDCFGGSASPTATVEEVKEYLSI